MPVAYRLRIRAKRDLENIAEFTAERWGAAQAERYIRGLEKKFEQLVTFPESAPAWRPGSPIRIASHESHRILYQRTTYGILIARVLHQASDLIRVLERKR
jgi:toxin ParE1/3/4